jgi:hypothetical protein
MRRTATSIKEQASDAAVNRCEVMYAVGSGGGAGGESMVIGHVPTLAQAFEAVELLVREHLAASVHIGDAAALGDALRDLRAEGPQGYGWWTDAAGYEIWYGPVLAAVPNGMTAGELALLATLEESLAGLVAAC